MTLTHVENLRDLLEDFDSMQKWPTPVFNDNSATVALSVDPHAHKKSVQLTRAMAYVRQRTAHGVIAPIFVRTTFQPADFLTKKLSEDAFARCRLQSGMLPLPPSLHSLSVQGGVLEGERPASARN